MSVSKATIYWQRNRNAFLKNEYSRKHKWVFDKGVTVSAAASPQIVPEEFTDDASIDPEEAFVASISSCHMLWFLSIASQRGFVVDSYTDHAEGKLAKNQEGKLAITGVILKPVISFGPDHAPEAEIFEEMHHQAHQRCFIAHSVKTEITIHANMDISS